MLRKIVCLVADDIFFSSKIQAAAEKLGARTVKVKKQGELHAKTENENIGLVIIDLASKKIDAAEIFMELKNSAYHRHLFCIGYLPHVEKELAGKFLEKGIDLVVPRSRFSREMHSIMREILESPSEAE